MGHNGGQQENISMKWEHSSVEVAGAIAIFIRSAGMVRTSACIAIATYGSRHLHRKLPGAGDGNNSSPSAETLRAIIQRWEIIE